MNDEVIKKRLKIIKDLQEELNKIKEAYDESLESDAAYQEVQAELDETKEATKKKQEKVLANSTYENFRLKMKEIRQDMAENREILSAELLDYYKTNDSTTIIDDEGREKKLKFSVKLVNS